MTAQASTSVVELRQDGDVLLVSVNNPPVNALGAAVRQGLMAAMEQADASAAVKAVVIVGQGKAFIAGADIREFGKPPVQPFLPDVCNRIEACSKPVVAVIHGAALGGGLEIAMSAHYRLALPGAKLGLPEVSWVWCPAPAAQRAPRLMGVKAATELMLSGQQIGAKAGLAAGLVDKLEEGTDPVAAGLAYARELLAQGAPLRPVSATPGRLADKAAAQAELDALRADTAKKSRGLFSPLKIIDCVQAALDLPLPKA
jgi:3-hydroxyacyl-CoA dehydrogenase